MRNKFRHYLTCNREDRKEWTEIRVGSGGVRLYIAQRQIPDGWSLSCKFPDVAAPVALPSFDDLRSVCSYLGVAEPPVL